MGGRGESSLPLLLRSDGGRRNVDFGRRGRRSRRDDGRRRGRFLDGDPGRRRRRRKGRGG